jgi:type I restriction enzyme S subunit
VVGSIGNVGLVPPKWQGANVARAVCRIVPGDPLDRRFLIEVLQSRGVQSYFEEATRTLAQPTLNPGQLTETPIPDLSLPDQRRIVAHLDALTEKIDLVRTLQSETSAELDALLPAILSRASVGKLWLILTLSEGYVLSILVRTIAPTLRNDVGILPNGQGWALRR